jgi:hypothetical protein
VARGRAARASLFDETIPAAVSQLQNRFGRRITPAKNFLPFAESFSVAA